MSRPLYSAPGPVPRPRVEDPRPPAGSTPPETPTSPSTRRRHTPAQIVAVLQRADELLTRGYPVTAVIDALGVSEATFHRWRAHYGGIKAEDARRLRELEKENRDLKSQVANQSLDILMLRQALSVDVLGPQLRSRIVTRLRLKFGVSERRACEVIGQSRSSQRRIGDHRDDLDDLVEDADDLDYAALAVAYADPEEPTGSGPP